MAPESTMSTAVDFSEVILLTGKSTNGKEFAHAREPAVVQCVTIRNCTYLEVKMTRTTN